MLTLCNNYFNVSPSNKGKEGQPYDRKRYLFGLFLLFLANVIWVVSSELTKYIYTEVKLERPFLITYVRSSFLLIYLIVLCFSPPTRDPCRPTDYTQLLEQSPETDDENYFNESSNSLGDSTFIPVRAGETTDSDDAAPRAVRFNKVAEVRVMSAAMAGEALLARLSWAASVRANEHAQRRAAAAATRRHLRLALLFSFPWFLSNYLYRLSLYHNSTGVATTYMSTTSAFALSLGAVCAPTNKDRFNLVKTLAVLLTTAGLVIIGTLGSKPWEWRSGAPALGAALAYAAHLVLLRRELRRVEGVNSPLLIGLVGCAVAVVWWSLGACAGALGVERVELPGARGAVWLLAEALAGPVLAEPLALWAATLTSPLTAARAGAAILPLALAVDVYHSRADAVLAVAAILTTLGWILALCERDISLDCLKAAQGFAPIRNVSDLSEQSEALMSEEPT